MNAKHGDDLKRRLRRREALQLFGGLGAAAVWRASGGGVTPARAAQTTPAAEASACVLTPEATAGPYYIANHLTRRNIRQNQPGLPLALHLTVQHATSCQPIGGADVEIWHANAVGVYSGYGGSGPPGGNGGHATPNNRLTFLRGHQISDAGGRVLFETIYPGWYRGRTPHIHLKVHVGGRTVHTGQLFFPDVVSDAVYRHGAYRSHGQPDTTNGADNIFGTAGGSRAIVALAKGAGGSYSGSIGLAVRS
jgi:protocatechuate 3,4-dioxygenase beta subunit